MVDRVPGRSITLDDVARRAGVHASTVSRVLSRPELVKAATLTRVQAAADELGYVPNRAARQLAGGRTSRLAVLVPDITNPWFAELVAEVESRAGTHDEHVLVAGTGHRSERELAAIRSMVGHVDGFIACSSVAPATALRAAVGSAPVVYVNRRAHGVPSVVVDQRSVIDLSVGHLRDLGHVDVAVVLGPPAYWSTDQRRRAAERAATTVVGPFAPTFDGGRDAFSAVRASGCTGVAMFNDVSAFGLVASAVDAGVAVPGDLSVVGSDDVPFAAVHRPALTTVDGRARAVGAEALSLLHHALATDETSDDIAVQPILVVRRSASTREPQ